jgi:uncharacterized membrane protein
MVPQIPAALAPLVVQHIVAAVKELGEGVLDRSGDPAASELAKFGRDLLWQLLPQAEQPSQEIARRQNDLRRLVANLARHPDSPANLTEAIAVVQDLMAADPDLQAALSKRFGPAPG